MESVLTVWSSSGSSGFKKRKKKIQSFLQLSFTHCISGIVLLVLLSLNFFFFFFALLFDHVQFISKDVSCTLYLYGTAEVITWGEKQVGETYGEGKIKAGRKV